MRMRWRVPGVAKVLGVAVALAGLGGMGCGGDDDDDGEAAAAEAADVAEAAEGGGATNAVEGADAAEAEADAADVVVGALNALAVDGEWNGSFSSDEGNGHLDLDLAQAEESITGQFNLSYGPANQVGNVAGSIDGDHLTLLLTVPGSAAWIELDGHVNAAATSYIGTWTGTFGEGDFALQK